MLETHIGFRVMCRDGWVGILKHVARNAVTGQAEYLVVELSRSGTSAQVPAQNVVATGHQAIFLDLETHQLEDPTWL